MRCRPRRAVTPAQGNYAVCGRLHLITRFAGASPQGEAVFIFPSHTIPMSNWCGRSQIAPTEVRTPSTAAKQPPEKEKTPGRLPSRPAFLVQFNLRQQRRAVERTPGMHPYQTFTSALNRKPGSGPAGPAREGGTPAVGECTGTMRSPKGWESRGNHGGTGAGSPQIPFGPSGAVLRKAYPMPIGKKVWLCKSSKKWLPLCKGSHSCAEHRITAASRSPRRDGRC